MWNDLFTYLVAHQLGLGIWVAAFLTLAIYSFLYADSPLFRAAEHLFVGISASYGAVIFFHQAIKPKIWYPLLALIRYGLDHWHIPYQAASKSVLLAFHASPADMVKALDQVPIDYRLFVFPIPFLLGLMIFGRFFRGYQWLSRWPIAFAVGFGAGGDDSALFPGLDSGAGSRHGRAFPARRGWAQPGLWGDDRQLGAGPGGTHDPGVLLFFRSAPGLAGPGLEARDLVPDGRFRRGLRQHRHGPRSPAHWTHAIFVIPVGSLVVPLPSSVVSITGLWVKD